MTKREMAEQLYIQFLAAAALNQLDTTVEHMATVAKDCVEFAEIFGRAVNP